MNNTHGASDAKIKAEKMKIIKKRTAESLGPPTVVINECLVG